jgi:outer membrane protein assembly factor BamA
MVRIVLCLSFLCILYPLPAKDGKLVINNISISGNNKTRSNIIVRELTFNVGDTILSSDLERLTNRSRENILNTSLFNYVTIKTLNISDERIDILIIVEERWYFWPALIFKYDDRNFSAWLKAKDLSKTKYGFSLEKFNFLGRKQNLRISFLFGYAKQFEMSYKNIALDRNRRHFIGAMAEISRQDEMIFDTKYDEPVLFKSTYQPVFERNKYTVNYTYRPFLNDFHNLYVNYFEYKVSDTILKLNSDFLGKNISEMECFTIDYVYTKDKRDIKAYPLKGYYFELLAGQTFSHPVSKNSFSSTVIIPNFYKFLEISSRLHYAANLTLKFSYNSTNSYFFSRSLGYIYNLHGFEYNTIEGEHFIILKNLVKFTLLKPKITELKFIPLPKFNKIHYAIYLNLFTDCGYVSSKYASPENDYSNKFLYSGGIGLDLVTYYDKTLRAEYSVNGFGKGGFYFHLTAPINK